MLMLKIFDEIQRNGKQSNVSMFAFTATPKPTTLQLFGRVNEQGQYEAFHIYSMKQAIEEKFILDVLQNYITYDTYYKLNKSIQDDPELKTSDAKRQIARYVSLHDENVKQRIEVIVEHFRATVMQELGGQAKAMVVTSSRPEAVKYKLEMDKYIEQQGYRDMRTLVAFSGKVKLEGHAQEFTEPGLNGFSEKMLPSEFARDDYQLLLVADKYQTGFDQPKLCAMYILKKLSGISTIQTLSRLNRICPPFEKHTFILDFKNKYEDVVKDFSVYYTTTLLSNTVTPRAIYDLEVKLDGWYIAEPEGIEKFNQLLYKGKKEKLTAADQKSMIYHLQKSKKQIEGYEEEERRQIVSSIRKFVRFYEFLIQVTCFEDKELHKKYNFYSFLQSYLKEKHPGGGFNLKGKIEASGFVQKKDKEHQSTKINSAPVVVLPMTDRDLGKEKLEKLSKIIADINSRTGKTFDNDVAVKAMLQIKDLMLKNDKLKISALNNSSRDFNYAYYENIDDALVAGYEQNENFFQLLLNDADLKREVFGVFAGEVYEAFRAAENAGDYNLPENPGGVHSTSN